MATPIIENEKKCTCDLKLGSHQIASENSSMSHVTASDGTRVGGQVELDRFKKTYAELTFDKHENVLSLPNEILLPKEAVIIEDQQHLKEDFKTQYTAKYLEDLLHQEMTHALRKKKHIAFGYKGYITRTLYGVALDRAKDQRNKERKDQKNKRNKETPEHNKTPDLNEFEIAFLKNFEIFEKMEETVEECVVLHRQWLKDEFENRENMNWLFRQERFTSLNQHF